MTAPFELDRRPESAGSFLCHVVGCFAPAWTAVLRDGLWAGQATCDSEEHAARAITTWDKALTPGFPPQVPRWRRDESEQA